MNMKKKFALSLKVTSLTMGITIGATSFAQTTPSDFETPEYYANWGLARIGAADAYSRGFSGAGVKIGIADSAVQLTHPEFSGRAYSPTPFPVFPTPGYADFPSHGTHVMGISGAARNNEGMMGVAYEASLVSVVAVGSPGYAETPNWATALVDAGVSVMNASLGPPAAPEKFLNGSLNPNHAIVNFQALPGSYLEENASQVYQLAAADIVMVFSAGNNFRQQPIASRNPDGFGMLPLITPANTQAQNIYRIITEDSDRQNPNTWQFVPLNTPELRDADLSDLRGSMLVVVATDRNNALTSFSNECGAAADWCIAAPGVDIYSSYPMNTYQDLSGTSQAAPLVTGVVAALRGGFPYLNARYIIDLILNAATDIGAPGVDTLYGNGLLNFARASLGPAKLGTTFFPEGWSIDTQGYDSTWGNDIVGAGGLSKAGAGILTMTGQNSYLGATVITGGVLNVQGSIASSALSIGQDATLKGNGVVGPATIEGTIAPGNSVGTITVAGDLIQTHTSVYEVEVDANQNSDLINVQGNVYIDSGAVIDLQAQDNIDLGQLYTILTATGSITGTYDESETDYPLLSISTGAFTTNPRSLQFVLGRNGVTMASFAQSGNQAAVAAAIDSQSYGAEPFDTVVLTSDNALFPNMFQSFSGEIYASNQAVLLNDSAITRQTLLWRMQDSWNDPALGRLQQTKQINDTSTSWVQVFGYWDRLASSANAGSVTANSNGFMMGVDHEVGQHSRIGLAFGFSGLETSVTNATASTQGHHLMVYGTTQAEMLRLSGGVGQSWYSTNTKRKLSGGLRTASASPNIDATQVFAELGIPLRVGATTWQPFVNASQNWLRTGSFQESGSEAALHGSDSDQSAGFGTLGVRAAHTWQTQATAWQFDAMAGWQRGWGDLAPTSTLQFDTGNPFTVTAAPLTHNALALELSIGASLDASSRVRLTYAGTFGSGNSSQIVQAQINWQF